MKTTNFFFAVLVLTTSALAFGSGDPEAIIKKVDDIRNPAESYAMQVEIVSKDKPGETAVFTVSIQGNTKTLIKTLQPPRDRGRNMLMLEEEMWAYVPNLKRAVRVSLSQKLTGQAANGDISRMRWSGDYDPKIESETAKEWVIYLTARKKGLTYDKVRAWIDKATYHPVKAEFLTPQGKPLKRATYGEYKQLAGKLRPSTMDIQDAVRPDEASAIKIASMQIQNFPAALFNQNSLK